MRKFTISLALMFVMVTAAMAQFDAEKEYRIKEVASGKYLNAANYETHETGANGGVNVVDLNQDSEDMIFIAEASEDGYMLKTKSGYYINGYEWNVDANSTETGAVLTFEQDGLDYLIKWYNPKKYSTCYFKVESVSGTRYPFCDANRMNAARWAIEEVVAGAVYTDVTYNYVFNGETIGSAVISAIVGEAYPEPVNVPFGYAVVQLPEDGVEENAVKTIECVEKLPFEFAESVDAIEHWYNMTIHATNPIYLQYVEGQDYVEILDNAVAEGEENSYLWGFVGNVANGFQIVNYIAKDKILVSANPVGDGNSGGYTFPMLVAATEVPEGYNTTWDVSESTYAINGFFVAQHGTTNRWNKRGEGKLTYWLEGADAGSTVLVSEATPVVVPETAIDNVDAEVKNNVIYDLTGRRVKEIAKAGIYIVNGKKVLVK